MDDITKTPYAEWLESILRSMMELKPAKIGFCMLCDDGAYTCYFGLEGPPDKAMMAHHIYTDSLVDIITANAKSIIEAAEEQENEDDENDKNDE